MHKYSWAHDPHGDIIKGLATVTQFDGKGSRDH